MSRSVRTMKKLKKRVGSNKQKEKTADDDGKCLSGTLDGKSFWARKSENN